jgi:hypothetical protein
MDSRVYFEVYAPGCETCGRKLELKDEFPFRVEGADMLRQAGFPDWAIWEEKPNSSVAIFARDTVYALNGDFLKFTNMVRSGSSVDVYVQSVRNLQAMAELCQQLPTGLTRVRTARVL